MLNEQIANSLFYPSKEKLKRDIQFDQTNKIVNNFINI